MRKLITQTLPQLLNTSLLSQEFLSITLLKRLISLLRFKDYHDTLIELIINLNSVLKIPPHELFLLFEPIMLTQTLTRFRLPYPHGAKTGPLAAFSKAALSINGDSESMVRPLILETSYISPYGDHPLEPKMRDKDRERFCPNVDELLNSN